MQALRVEARGKERVEKLGAAVGVDVLDPAAPERLGARLAGDLAPAGVTRPHRKVGLDAGDAGCGTLCSAHGFFIQIHFI